MSGCEDPSGVWGGDPSGIGGLLGGVSGGNGGLKLIFAASLLASSVKHVMFFFHEQTNLNDVITTLEQRP